MVEVMQVQTVCLDPSKPCAREYDNPRIDEVVTELDTSPSLYAIVMTGNAGSMPNRSDLYQYPDLGDDDEAHGHPDYERLNKSDIVEKEQFVSEWTENPKNYEPKKEEPKKEEPSTTPPTEGKKENPVQKASN